MFYHKDGITTRQKKGRGGEVSTLDLLFRSVQSQRHLILTHP